MSSKIQSMLEKISGYTNSIIENEVVRDYYINLIENIEIFIIIFLFVANSMYLVILILGYINSKRKYKESYSGFIDDATTHTMLESISMLLPCYNEENSIVESVSSTLRLNYPKFEAIVINDGSVDKSLSNLIDYFKLVKVDYRKPQTIKTSKIKAVYFSKNYKNLVVIDKYNGGKADALNAGVNYSKHPYICCLDSDSILDVNGLKQIYLPFFENPVDTIAVGGTIRVVNDTNVEYGRVLEPKLKFNYFTVIQVVEYIRAFLVGRMGWDFLNANTLISGAFGLFKRDAILKVGGYSTNTVGEDMELVLRMQDYYTKHKIPYNISFLPFPVCWTEVPSDIRTLSRQRSRWQQGLVESLWSAKSLFFKPSTKMLGLVAMPYLFLFEVLAAPLELASYLLILVGLSLGLMDIKLVVLFFCVSMLYGFILSLGGIIIEELTFKKYKRPYDFILLFFGCILEQLGFRQLHLLWRLKGIWNSLVRNKHWGVMVKKGFK